MTSQSRRTRDFSAAYMFVFSLRFSEVFWVLFMRSKGLSFAAIGLLETIFHMASLFGEIPTGVIADRYGRKVSLLVGRALAALSAFMVLTSRTWTMTALGFAVHALSYTCHSGAFEALVYDNLPQENRSDFARVWGSLNSVYLIGTSLATVSAGLIARVSLAFLYKVNIAADLAGMVIVLLMSEMPRSGSCQIKRSLGEDFRALVATLRRGDLRNLMALWGIVSALIVSVKFYGQALLRDSLVPILAIAVADTAANLTAVLPTRYAYKIEKKYGQIGSVLGGSLAAPLTVLFMAIIPGKTWGIFRVILVACYLGLTVISETLYPLFSDAVNARVESHNRASVLSSGSMLFSISMMVMFPAIGYLGDRTGLSSGMMLAAILTLLTTIPLVVSLKRLARSHADVDAGL